MSFVRAIAVFPRYSVIGRNKALTDTVYFSTEPPGKKISAAKLKSIAGAITKREHLKVEKDPHKLAKYVCGANIYKDGIDPEIKPDEEYPDWLWTLRTDWTPVPIEELDKDTYIYWRKIRRRALVRMAQQRQTKRKLFDFSRN